MKQPSPPTSPVVEPKRVRIPARDFELSALDYGEPNQDEPNGSDLEDGASTPMLLVHGMRDLAWSMDSIARFLIVETE